VPQTIENLRTSVRYASIQDAIDDAAGGDEIVVGPGIYQHIENIYFKGKNLVLRSTQPDNPAVVSATIINGGDKEPAVTFSGGENADCVLDGFNIIGGTYGIYCSTASPTIANCTITGGRSAGIKLWNQSNPKIINCIIAGNNGAGVEMFALDTGRVVKYNYATITNCTIVGNKQQGVWGDIPTIANSIICYNGDLCDDVQIQSFYAVVIYSDVQGGWPGVGNIDMDPCFVSPGYWASVDDPNVAVEPNDANAVWIEGDYHLRSQGWRWHTQRKAWTWDDVTSPCIDAGNPGSAIQDEPMVLAIDPDSEWGQNVRIDMGAYGGTVQAGMPPLGWALLGDLTNDGTVNFQDYGFQVGGSSNTPQCQPGDLNRNGVVDLADVAILADDWLNRTSWH